MKTAGILVALSIALAPVMTFGQTVAPNADWSMKEAGLIPVQGGGRVKPLDTFAREAVLFATGKRIFEGWEPVDMFFSWISHPQEWNQKAFIQIGREDVKRQLGLDEKRRYFSPAELFTNPSLAQYADLMGKPQTVTSANPVAAHQDPRQQELRHVLDRIALFRSAVSGHSWLVVPRTGSGAEGAWDSLAGQGAPGAADASAEAIRGAFVNLVRAHQKGDREIFERSAIEARKAVEARMTELKEGSPERLSAEGFFNRARPFHFAWILYATGAVLWVVASAVTRKRGWVAAAALASISAIAFHVGGMALRCYIAGRPPVTNMYESVVWVALGCVVFASVLFYMQRLLVAPIVACTIAMTLLMLSENAPAVLDPTINPLVPVLRSNFWLTIHVLTITLGYAAFTLTLGLADVTLFQFLRRRSDAPGATVARSQKIAGLNQLTYRATQFGVVCLAAGTILGGIWADYSWGRFWGWDPKEVWALIALLCYLAILHARFTGWMGQFGYAAWSVVAFLSVLMAWYGVNFVLGVGLHSYGFSSGGRGGVAGFTLLQLVYVGIAALAHRRATASH